MTKVYDAKKSECTNNFFKDFEEAMVRCLEHKTPTKMIVGMENSSVTIDISYNGQGLDEMNEIIKNAAAMSQARHGTVN